MKIFICTLFLPWLFSLHLCEVTEDKKIKLVSDFIKYYNLQPNKNYTAFNGQLQSVREIDNTTYSLDVAFNTEGDEIKRIVCTATVHELEEDISIVNNDLKCAEEAPQTSDGDESEESGEVQEMRMPIKLENEVQADTAITSGEQFIAIPRDQPSAPCIGCSSHVNPEAAGVQDLANMGVRHLNIHEPNVKHSLESVIEVERQVQVVNGVRYILTLSISFNNCSDTETESCIFLQTCKVSILVKPWQTLPSGAKYRAILANNCTEEWLFGDNGEILPENTDICNHNDNNSPGDIDGIKLERHEDVQSQPNQDKSFTTDELKALEDQILPHDHVPEQDKLLHDSATINKVSDKIESTRRYNADYVPVTEFKQDTSGLNQDKKKAIDGILDIFNFSSFKPKLESRKKRSFVNNSNYVGGEKLKNVKNPKYTSLAKESLQKYVQSSSSQRHYSILRLERVTVQVVSGTLTKIDFIISPTDCTIKSDGSPSSSNCNFVNAEVTIKCHSEIWEQTWLNNKQYTVNCKTNVQNAHRKRQVLSLNETTSGNDIRYQSINDSKYKKQAEDSLHNRVKRQVTGGLTEHNPNNSKYLTLAEESLQKYVNENGLHGSHKVVRVEKVYTQLVAGSLTKIDFEATSVGNGGLSCHSDIWEKPWENFKDIKVSCQNDNQRLKRQLPGGLKLQNPNDPEYLTLAEESLQKYVRENGLHGSHKVVRVEEVYTQVVAGSMTKIDFVATSVGNDELRCHSDIWTKPWENFKDIKVSCQNNNQRLKRQLPGGLELQNPNDPEYLTLAEESLQKYVRENGLHGSHEVVRVEKVYTQVVAGSMTKIDFVATSVGNGGLSCHSEIWEKPWENFKDIKVSCQNDNQRLKRQLLGGNSEQNANDPKYLTLAEESLQKYVQDKGFHGSHKVVRVEKVYTQVVAGSMTKIDFVATSVGNEKLRCHSDIWTKPWENFKDIKVSCQNDNQRLKRQLPGGLELQNPNDPEYLTLAEESLQKYVRENGLHGSHKVVRVEKVYTQVVAGSMTKIDFVATSVGNGGLSCHSDIWTKPWENFKDIKVSCQNDNQRLKRQLPGGLELQNPNDPEYLTLAEESLQKYVRENGLHGSHEVVRVEKVYTQVVAGSMTKIDFVATSVGNGGLRCHSDIWEKPWENFKDIKVSCQNGNQRLKRQLLGGNSEKNPNDPKYLSLAEESLQKYVQDTGFHGSHKVVRVEKVYTQVVAGSMTKIDFVATSPGNADGDELSCHSDIWEQLWINKKEIEVSCKIKKGKRRKRQVTNDFRQEDPDKPLYLQLAQESLQKYLTDTRNQRRHVVDRIISVFTRVSDGVQTKIDFLVTPVNNPNADVFNCMSNIWIKSSQYKKDINVFCAINYVKLKDLHNCAIKKKDPTNPIYLRMGQDSLEQFLYDNGHSKPHKVIQVTNVTMETCYDTMTRIYFLASPADNLEDTFKCFSSIWKHFWLSEKERNVSCQIDVLKRHVQVPHSFTEENPAEGKYLMAAEKSLNKYISNAGNNQSHRVVRIERVLVSSMLTKIYFEAVLTDNPSVIMNCTAKIFKRNLVDSQVTCVSNELKYRQKRELLLGNKMNKPQFQNKNDEKEEDVTKPEYKLLAAQALRKFSKRTGILYKLIEVAHVTKRVVAGLIYNIKFSASPTECSSEVSNVAALSCKSIRNITVDCNAHIWDKPWIRKIKIDVQCSTADDIGNQDYSDEDTDRGNGNAVETKLSSQEIQDSKVRPLAEEALEKYLSLSNKKYFYKITKILIYNVHQQNGIVRNIKFSISPTVCLRHVYIDSIENCKFKKPRSHYICIANIHEKSLLTVQKDIEITCKKLSDKKSKFAIRLKRQIPIENDNKEDEDTTSYYADRVLQEVNKRFDGNDLFKMVSIHAVHRNMQNQSPAVKLLIEIAKDLEHKLCQAKIYPSPADKFNIKDVSVVCDGNDIEMLLNMTMKELEKDPGFHFKIVQHGKAKIIPKVSDGSNEPIELYFAIAPTNCSINTATNCLANVLMPLKYCRSLIWIDNKSKTVKNINASCEGSFSIKSENDTDDDFESNTIPRKFYNNIDDQLMAKPLTKQALRVIEAKYPQPNKQKIGRILSFKEVVTNSHYRMLVDVGLTNCTALSEQNVCEIINGTGRVCRIDVWLDKLSDRSPLNRVYCEVDKETATENENQLSLFIKFLDKYNPTYIDNDTEWQYRFQIFKDNIREIHSLNVFEKATATYGVTRFMDLTSEEFNLKYTGLNKDLRDDKHRRIKDAVIPNIKMPSSYDWREFDAVTEVKDQGSCGNSWAFSVTGNIESQIKIKTKKLLPLSEQQLMKCDQFNKGCDGGLPENAYRAITDKGAAECLLDDLAEKVKISGGLNIASNETDMAKWITLNGPISIGVNSAPLQFYMSGVIHLSSFYCNNAKLTHNALIVGYGEEEHPIYKKKIPYWVIKNSWGKNWGEEGYYRMYRGNGTCGVNKMATSAEVTTLSV